MKKKILSFTLASFMVTALFMPSSITIRATESESSSEGVTETASESVVESSLESLSESIKDSVVEQSNEEDTYVFTDDAGREVTLPKNIKKVAPSGSVSTFLLYTVARDKLVAVNKTFSKKQIKFIPEKYQTLPEIGQFYGKSANLNMETLVAEAPDVIIDLGEAKKTIKEDMDSIQEQVNIPTIFIEARTETMADTYRKLGKVLGEEEHAEKLAKYCEEILKKATEVRENLKEDEKKTVYWAMGDAGLNTNAKESFQSEVLQIVGAENVVDLEAQSRGGATEVSMEDILQWSPEYVLIDNPQLADTMSKEEAWQAFYSEKDAKSFVVPFGPYGFLSNPPSANRFMGILWLGNLLYPEKYNIDLNSEMKKFYDLFYGIELTDEEISMILVEDTVDSEKTTDVKGK